MRTHALASPSGFRAMRRIVDPIRWRVPSSAVRPSGPIGPPRDHRMGGCRPCVGVPEPLRSSPCSPGLAACGGVQQSTQPSGSAGTGAGESPGGAPAARGCVTTETPAAGTGGTVRVGIGGSADSLNPGLGAAGRGVRAVRAGLRHAAPSRPTATTSRARDRGSVAEDDVTWTVTFRDDVTFHDGTPMTAEDVKFSLELYRDNHRTSRRTPTCSRRSPWRTRRH